MKKLQSSFILFSSLSCPSFSNSFHVLFVSILLTLSPSTESFFHSCSLSFKIYVCCVLFLCVGGLYANLCLLNPSFFGDISNKVDSLEFSLVIARHASPHHFVLFRDQISSVSHHVSIHLTYSMKYGCCNPVLQAILRSGSYINNLFNKSAAFADCNADMGT